MKITKQQLRKIITELNITNPVQIDDHEELLFQVAMKIKDIMPAAEALDLIDADFRSMVVGVYEDYFDPTEEGWEPYIEDLATVENHLTIVPIPGDDDYEQSAVYESRKMKITKRQLSRIIREAIDPREFEEPLGGWVGDALHNDPDFKHSTDTDATKNQNWKDHMNSMGYTDGLEGMMPVSMSSLKDPDYMAGKKAGERDRMNDPYSEENIAQPE